MVVTGAEKLSPEVAEAFQQRFGVRPVEGYGATELSPVVSVNIPPSRAIGTPLGPGSRKAPSAGRCWAWPSRSSISTRARTSGRTAPACCWSSGPNVMKGYFGRPDLTAEVIHDGWYMTGDVATIDDEGFITITGRISRFSKLGGEMVPHIRVEEAIAKMLALGEDELKVVVTAVPDPKKGERLVVLYTRTGPGAGAICRALAAGGLPPLWIPSPDSFRRVAAIPAPGHRQARSEARQGPGRRRVCGGSEHRPYPFFASVTPTTRKSQKGQVLSAQRCRRSPAAGCDAPGRCSWADALGRSKNNRGGRSGTSRRSPPAVVRHPAALAVEDLVARAQADV